MKHRRRKLSHYLPAQAAEMLGITKQAMRDRIRRGTVPVVSELGHDWVPAVWVEQELEKKKKEVEP